VSPRRSPALLAGLIGVLALVAFTAPPPAARAAYVHTWEGNFPVAEPESFVVPLAVGVDNSGGPGDGSVYTANFAFSQTDGSEVAKFAPDGTLLDKFDGAETPAGQFSFVSAEFQDSGLAVDSSSGPNAGSVYVADVMNSVIDRFSEDGTYVCQITGSPTPSASECNVAGSEVPGGGFSPSGVIVDPATGVLYVADRRRDVILRFDSGGAYAGEIASPALTAPNSLAIDSTGALYVANVHSYFNFETTNVVKLSPSGEFLFEVTDKTPSRVTVDPTTDRLYVAEGLEGARLVEFTPAGARVAEFGTEQELLAPSLAVDADSGRIYATNARFGDPSRIELYGKGAAVPDVLTGEVTDVTEVSARLHGSVDPAEGGDVTFCEFEYVEDSDYDPAALNPYAAGGPPVPCDDALPIGSASQVSATLGGLQPSTTYHARIVAANANEVRSRGPDVVFATRGAPTIDEQSVTNIERFGATLTARINPHGFPAEFRFEFVDDAHFLAEGGFSGPAVRSTVFSEIGSGLEPLSVNQNISGLTVGTTYHFRAVARNSTGTVLGPDGTFTTVPVAAIERQWAYAHVDTATLEARINPLGMETRCRVEYVAGDQFDLSGFATARSQPCVAALGNGSDPLTARAEIDGLQKATTYHFRFLAENASGVLGAGDGTFTTFGIEDFSIDVVDAEGNPYTQAGGHPFASITHFAYNHTMVESAGNGSEGSVNAFIREVLTETPVGRVGSAVATPRCPGYLVEEERCSGDSQVGTITIEYFNGGSRNTRTRGLYNVFTPAGTASRFSSIDPYVNTDAFIRTGGDYGTTIGTYDITEEARIVGVTATIWGVPADPRHDPQRRCPGIGTGCASNAAPLPLLRNPTSCGGPLTSRAVVDTWQRPGDFDTATDIQPAIVGCEQLPFEPTIEVEPTTTSGDSPTGMKIQIHLPQDQDPEAVATADMREISVRMPEGVVLNPAVAGGLQSCGPEQIDLDGSGPARCPEASKVGSVSLETPMLEDPLPGAVYVATPDANPFDSLFALYVAVHDPATGVVIKLAGEVEADPVTGRLTAIFPDSPQLPFEDLTLRLFGGDRAMLRTPPLCGTYRAEATLTPWSAPASGPPARPTDAFSITGGANGGGCVNRPQDARHAPELTAGTTRPVAGGYSPFVLRLRREDGSQELGRLSLQLPPGLLARLAEVPFCPPAALAATVGRDGAAEQASPSCPRASDVGEVEIGAGAGPIPFLAKGRAYLAGPYDGAPLSLAIVVPALAGPYDLGTVTVRAALRVDPRTTEILVDSDPLPTILDGIPLDIRSIGLRLDRPRFILNPTSCRAMALSGKVDSVLGATAPLHSPFRARDCGRLRFEPRLGMRLFGGTRRGEHPSLRTVLDMPGKGANIARASVTLPPTQFLDNENLLGICTREQFASKVCPADSVYGRAVAWSPLLDKPLAGPVYLRSSNHRLPDLVADLDGRIRFLLRGRIDSAAGGIRVNLEGIPDAPVDRFVLVMRGGRRGLLQNSADVCADRRRAQVRFESHSGRVSERRPLLRPQCTARATARAVRRASNRKSTRNPPSLGWKPTK